MSPIYPLLTHFQAGPASPFECAPWGKTMTARTSRAGMAIAVTCLAGHASAVGTGYPPGCMVSTKTFENSLARVIPSGPAVVTSTINVTNLRGQILDVDVWTLLSHGRPSDLDITLRSPNGRVVTLTTDNGAFTPDAFMGTLWNDSANPGGQVPYASNPGLVTDHPYGSVSTTTLVPEEPLGAFESEVDPNGAWTLTISDDQAGVGGTLYDWILVIQTTPPWFGAVHQGTNTTPARISAAVPSVVTSTITIPPDGPAIQYMDLPQVDMSLLHSAPGDLDITLTSPAGTVVTLTSDNGGTAADAFAQISWRDEMNPFGQVPYTSNDGLATDRAYVSGLGAGWLVPEEPLAAFRGEDPRGTWTLTVSDDSAGNGGVLQSWQLLAQYRTECVSKGDFHLDQADDLVFRNVVNNQHMMWKMDGVTRVEQALVTPAPKPTQRAVGADTFVGASFSDLVFYDTVSGQVEFWPMIGAERQGAPTILSGAAPLPLDWKPAATGDFNHDGYGDLVWLNSSTQKLVIWNLAATHKIGTMIPNPDQAVDVNWELVGALDFDSDNNRDFLWYNRNSGRVVLWFMDESVQRLSGTFTEPASAGDANWRVVATGDYGPGSTGDQIPDIVWRNQDSGRLVVWYMDGRTSPPTRLAGTFTSPDSPENAIEWTVVGPR